MLENKLGITSQSELALAEERMSKRRAYELFEKGILNTLAPGNFSSLAKIHEYLFEELYDFAGKIRTVNIAKGNFIIVDLFYQNEIGVLLNYFSSLSQILI